MSEFLKKMLMASVIFCCGFGFAACSDDDDNNENNVPEIFTEVSKVWEGLGCSGNINDFGCSVTKCSELRNTLKELEKESLLMDEACKGYKESLNKADGKTPEKKVETLIKDYDNSGYYLSAFLIANGLTEKFTTCEEAGLQGELLKKDQEDTRDAWSKHFSAECDGFLGSAKTVAQSRGK